MSKYLDEMDDKLEAQMAKTFKVIPLIALGISAVMGTFYVVMGGGSYHPAFAFFVYFFGPLLMMWVPALIWFAMNGAALWYVRAGRPRER